MKKALLIFPLILFLSCTRDKVNGRKYAWQFCMEVCATTVVSFDKPQCYQVTEMWFTTETKSGTYTINGLHGVITWNDNSVEAFSISEDGSSFIFDDTENLVYTAID